MKQSSDMPMPRFKHGYSSVVQHTTARPRRRPEWGAEFKVTEVNLKSLSDPDMLLMIEKGIGDVISMISTRFGKTNNPNLNDKTDGMMRTINILNSREIGAQNYKIHRGIKI